MQICKGRTAGRQSRGHLCSWSSWLPRRGSLGGRGSLLASTTIRALLESRLDRCSPDVAHVLELASVQGSRSASTSWRPSPQGHGSRRHPSDRPSGRISRRRSSRTSSLRSRARPRDRVPTPPRRRREPTSTPRSVLPPGPGRGAGGVHLEQAATLCAELDNRTQTWNAVPVNCWPGRGRGPSRDSTWLRRPTSSARGATATPRFCHLTGHVARLRDRLMEAGRVTRPRTSLRRPGRGEDPRRRDVIRPAAATRLVRLRGRHGGRDQTRDRRRRPCSRSSPISTTTLGSRRGDGDRVLHVLVGEMANHAEAQNRSFVHAERNWPAPRADPGGAISPAR